MKRIQLDYKPTQSASRRADHRIPWFIAGVGIPLVAVAFILHGNREPEADSSPASEYSVSADDPGATAPPNDAPDTGSPPAQNQPPKSAPAVATDDSGPAPAPATSAKRADPAGDNASPPELATIPRSGELLTLSVRRGDSLDRMFRRNKLSRGDLANVMLPELSREYLRLLKPGEKITVRHDSGRIMELTREIDISRSLGVWRSDHGYVASLIDHAPEVRQAFAEGRISSSLFEAAAEAGISDRAIMNLAGIFAWDVDFVLDIREGDSFSVIYEELWRDGERLGEGDILAAEFVNQGRAFRAVRYRDPSGRVDYFTPDGKSVRKAFIRAPVAFSRISSNFNPRRRHPVLHTIRAHRGVDYAAPKGTPVKAAGDGKIIHRGNKGGYGKAVILQHGSNITTLYAHLSRFSKTARYGSRVKQGDVIGYVGSTGLATAAHLHYEYRRNGVHMNPRTVELPDAAPIDPAYLADFQHTARPLLEGLDHRRRLVVRNTPVAE